MTFPCHLVGGLFLLSNNAILQSESFENQNDTIDSINDWSNKAIGFNVLSDQFQNLHLIFFICCNMFFITLLVFQKPLTDYGIKYLGFLCIPCRRLQDRIEKTKIMHDNYYEYINLKFLLNEHKRTAVELDSIRKTAIKSPKSVASDGDKLEFTSPNVARLAGHMEAKKKQLEDSIC